VGLGQLFSNDLEEWWVDIWALSSSSSKRSLPKTNQCPQLELRLVNQILKASPLHDARSPSTLQQDFEKVRWHRKSACAVLAEAASPSAKWLINDRGATSKYFRACSHQCTESWSSVLMAMKGAFRKGT
jgi:hypothetical protein